MNIAQKVTLIFPRAEIRNTKSLWQPPLSLLYLATFIKKCNSELEIKVVNGEVEKVKDNDLDADVVGLSTKVGNYRNALELAERAKSKGAVVILGGHYAYSMPEIILKNRNFIDGIVVGDGEKALNNITEGKNFSEIKNLVFRRDGKIIRNEEEVLGLDLIQFPRREFINMNTYFENYPKFEHTKFKRPTTFISQRGCFWMQKSSGCIFCARTEKPSFRNPRNVWNEVKYLENSYKTDYLFDVSDNFTQNKEWLKSFTNSKPKTDVKFKIWMRSSEIDDNVAKMLQHIGVHDAWIGIESGDQNSLKLMNKGTTPKQNINAVKILKRFGIKVFAQFVLGAPNETKDSLKNTVIHAKELVETDNIETMGCGVLLPLPGSKSFEMMKRYLNLDTDLIDFNKVQRLWIDKFTRVSIEELIKTEEKILGLPTPIKYKKDDPALR